MLVRGRKMKQLKKFFGKQGTTTLREDVNAVRKRLDGSKWRATIAAGILGLGLVGALWGMPAEVVSQCLGWTAAAAYMSILACGTGDEVRLLPQRAVPLHR
jgi:hypothetical protein